MRFYKTRRLRIISGASVVLALTATPIFLSLTRPKPGEFGEAPALATTYTAGLSSLGLAGLVASGLAILFLAWLFNSQAFHVGEKYVGRRRRNLDRTFRAAAVILGSAGLIVGSLAGLYAAMIHARPDLYLELPMPFLTAELALASLLGGGAVYAAGRLGR